MINNQSKRSKIIRSWHEMEGTYQEQDSPLGEKLDVGDVPDEAKLVEHDAGAEEAEDLQRLIKGESERGASEGVKRGVGTRERYFTGLARMTRKAGTTRTVTPRKVSVSKPRSLITSTAPLARSMSIPARGARSRRPLLAASRTGACGELSQAPHGHGRRTQHACRAGARR